MENIFEKIEKAERINHQRKQLKVQQEIVLTPVLTDLKLVNPVLEQVIDLYIRSPDVERENYSLRDYFIVLAVLLYCPRAYAGETIKRGLRDAIAAAMGLTPTHISNRSRKLWEWCRHYKDFRKGVRIMYVHIASQFKESVDF